MPRSSRPPSGPVAGAGSPRRSRKGSRPAGQGELWHGTFAAPPTITRFDLSIPGVRRFEHVPLGG